MLPVATIDGRVITESATIATVLEEKFPEHTPLLPAAGTPERVRADGRGVHSTTFQIKPEPFLTQHTP